MGLSHDHVGPTIWAKIKIYILTRDNLLYPLCYEIPCTSKLQANDEIEITYIDVSRWIWPLCWVHINAIIYLGNAPTWSLLPNLYHNGFKSFVREHYFFQAYLCSRDIWQSVHANFIKIKARLQAISLKSSDFGSSHKHVRFLFAKGRCIKVHIFWEGHKILWNLHLTFDWHYIQK